MQLPPPGGPALDTGCCPWSYRHSCPWKHTTTAASITISLSASIAVFASASINSCCLNGYSIWLVDLQSTMGLPKWHSRESSFGSTYTKIGTIQRRLAWPLCKDDRQILKRFPPPQPGVGGSRVRRGREWSFPHSSGGKECTCNAGDPGLIPGLGRSPGEGKGYPL